MNGGSMTLEVSVVGDVDPRLRLDTQLSTAGFGFAGWMAILAVATSVPRLTFEIVLGVLSGGAAVAQVGLRASDAVLGFYLLLSLRPLLKNRFNLRSADSVLAWWIAFGAFFCLISVLLPRWNGSSVELPALLAGIGVGALLDVALGVMLFRLKEDYYGGLTAYAFSHIAAGLCVILSTLG